jgi:hypothetical protein
MCKLSPYPNRKEEEPESTIPACQDGGQEREEVMGNKQAKKEKRLKDRLSAWASCSKEGQIAGTKPGSLSGRK